MTTDHDLPPLDPENDTISNDLAAFGDVQDLLFPAIAEWHGALNFPLLRDELSLLAERADLTPEHGIHSFYFRQALHLAEVLDDLGNWILEQLAQAHERGYLDA